MADRRAIAAEAPTSARFRCCSLKLPWISDCIDGSSSEAPSPADHHGPEDDDRGQILRERHRQGADRVAEEPQDVGLFRPNRSPILLPIKMNAAETSASSAIADWTPLTVVSRSRTTAEIETFINEVSTTNTNIAIASSKARRWLLPPASVGGAASLVASAIERIMAARRRRGDHRRNRAVRLGDATQHFGPRNVTVALVAGQLIR